MKDETRKRSFLKCGNFGVNGERLGLHGSKKQRIDYPFPTFHRNPSIRRSRPQRILLHVKEGELPKEDDKKSH